MKKKILFTKKEVKNAILKIKFSIEDNIYKKDPFGCNPLFCIILKGGYKVGSLILRQLSENFRKFDITFIICKSYGNDINPQQTPELIFSDPIEIFKDRDVILVDDILDTGKTLNSISTAITDIVKSLKIVVLVNKTARREIDIKEEIMYGFEVKEDLFLLGYGMGHGELYRNENFISYYDLMSK